MTVETNSNILDQDGLELICQVAQNPVGRDLAWNWLRGSWDTIQYIYPLSDTSSAAEIVPSCVWDFKTEYELAQLSDFYDTRSNDLEPFKESYEALIRETQANIEWTKNHYNRIFDWLN